MKFGEKIRRYRENNNLTQKDLGDQLHLTDDAIYKWEAGKSFPDVPMLRNLVELTGYDAETLTNDTRSIEAYYGLPVSAKTFLYEKTINARDSVHEIYDIGLRKGVKFVLQTAVEKNTQPFTVVQMKFFLVHEKKKRK